MTAWLTVKFSYIKRIQHIVPLFDLSLFTNDGIDDARAYSV